MANRHVARTLVLQTLFEWDFMGMKGDLHATFMRNRDEFAPELTDAQFAVDLLNTVIDKQRDLDALISKAAPDWPINKISPIDRTILRMGLSELLFGDHSDVPPKVAINEAIELAKDFGGEASGKFVNGVMGAVYRELGEPGKDDKPKKNPKMMIPDDKAPVDPLVGAVVFSKHDGRYEMAFVHDVFGRWTLSKGHTESNESPENAIVRIVKEEMSLNTSVIDKLGENSYIAYDPEKGKLKKHVTYFLLEAEYAPIALGKKGGLDKAQWFLIDDVSDLNFYDDILPMVTSSIKIILDRTNS